MFKTLFLNVIFLLGLGCFLPGFAGDRKSIFPNEPIDRGVKRVMDQSIHFTKISGGDKTDSQIKQKDTESRQVNESEKSKDNLAGNIILKKRWRLSITGGGGYRIASTKESRRNMENQGIPSWEIDSYFKQLKTGITTAGQVHYMIWESYGLGIDYHLHHSSGSMNRTVDTGDNYTLIYGKFDDDVFTNYVGLSLFMQQWIMPKFKFYGQISSGLTLFREESVIVYSPLLITGNAYGGNTELGLEYYIGKKISFGLSAGFFQSSISKIKMNNGIRTEEVKLEKEQMEGLSRIDFGAGLRFYL